MFKKLYQSISDSLTMSQAEEIAHFLLDENDTIEKNCPTYRSQSYQPIRSSIGWIR